MVFLSSHDPFQLAKSYEVDAYVFDENGKKILTRAMAHEGDWVLSGDTKETYNGFKPDLNNHTHPDPNRSLPSMASLTRMGTKSSGRYWFSPYHYLDLNPLGQDLNTLWNERKNENGYGR